jgi:GNAT superfamily N-acetyltransferase
VTIGLESLNKVVICAQDWMKRIIDRTTGAEPRTKESATLAMDPPDMIRIRPLAASELGEANRILRLAFGEFLGVTDPLTMFPGRDLVSTRWKADPNAAFAAVHGGRLIGTNFVTNWGSFGFLGPITVLPEFWDKKVAQALLEPTMALFDRWGIAHRGLFTFPHSPKHIHLYEKYGFQAGNLTPILKKTVSKKHDHDFDRLTSLSKEDRDAAIEACRSLTGNVLPGLDLTRELLAVVSQGLGEVCLIRRGTVLIGFGVCHLGTDTEAGDNSCYVKFGAVDPCTGNSSEHFSRLLGACEAVASQAGMEHISLGVNMGRRRAYEQVARFGYRTEFVGVAMETHPERTYNRPELFVIDDWR